MKKVVVIGCKGMAGHVVKTYLESIGTYDVWGIARGVKPENNLINLDVSNIKELDDVLNKGVFDVVINCIGLLNKTAEDNPDLAVWLNSYFPHLLSILGNKYDFKLIHISTDCVFSGTEGGYTEDSFKNGNGFYAQSKALGEVINNKDLTFRTSIIGPEIKLNGIGLFHWFMNQNEVTSGYKNVYWTGVTTLELAKAIKEAINSDLKGLYHLVNNSKISKLEILTMFNEIFKNNNIKIISNNNKKVDKSLINSRVDFNFSVPGYYQMFTEMKKWIIDNRELYCHYNIL
jgi:dTDP-4-dehydrorhamnose reductase